MLSFQGGHTQLVLLQKGNYPQSSDLCRIQNTYVENYNVTDIALKTVGRDKIVQVQLLFCKFGKINELVKNVLLWGDLHRLWFLLGIVCFVCNVCVIYHVVFIGDGRVQDN